MSRQYSVYAHAPRSLPFLSARQQRRQRWRHIWTPVHSGYALEIQNEQRREHWPDKSRIAPVRITRRIVFPNNGTLFAPMENQKVSSKSRKLSLSDDNYCAKRTRDDVVGSRIFNQRFPCTPVLDSRQLSGHRIISAGKVWTLLSTSVLMYNRC